MTRQRPLVHGRLPRMLQMARVGVRSGLAMIGSGDGLEAARQATEVLGRMRGLAVKAGQMASYVDGVIPEKQSAAFRRLLSSLQAAAPSSHFAEIQQAVEAELRKPLDQCFSRFEPTPCASASLGQVHLAALHDGREVAVKVQHPGITEALDADLRNAGAIANTVAVLVPSVDADVLYKDIAARFREELDYELEARRQRAFRELFASNSRIRVPQVIDTHSTARVLTTEFVRGLSYESALAQPVAIRSSHAETLWRFVFGSLLVHGLFNADPHPGNYIFHEDGAVTFLDFGCVERLTEPHLRGLRAMHRAALNHDAVRFREAVRMAFETADGAFELELVRHLWRCLEPLRTRDYRVERAYVAGLVTQIQSLKKLMLKRGANVTPMPPGMLLLHRLHFGFYSVLARFDVQLAYGRIQHELLNDPSSLDACVKSF